MHVSLGIIQVVSGTLFDHEICGYVVECDAFRKYRSSVSRINHRVDYWSGGTIFSVTIQRIFVRSCSVYQYALPVPDCGINCMVSIYGRNILLHESYTEGETQFPHPLCI